MQKKNYKMLNLIKFINVPGVYEIPIAIRKNINKFDGFVALVVLLKVKLLILI